MHSRFTPLILLLSAPAVCLAAPIATPYVGVAYEQQSISLSDNDFDTGMFTVHAGAWLWEGIGLEFELGKGIDDDKQNGVSVEHASLLRYGLRLQTPSTPNQTVLYVLFSGATSKLGMQTAGDGIPGNNSFNGYHAGIGIGTQLNSKVQLDLSYNNYQVDESIDVTGFRLNIEYTFAALKR